MYYANLVDGLNIFLKVGMKDFDLVNKNIHVTAPTVRAQPHSQASLVPVCSMQMYVL